jgi:glycosyltransferase involved in cell wall biosynthesis
MRTDLRVGVDVTALLAGNTGVARYVREVTSGACAAGVEVVPFAIGRGQHDGTSGNGIRRLRLPLRVVHRSWSLLGRPTVDRLAPGCDVIHTPDLLPPPTDRPVVLTVHDVVALEHPDLHPPRAARIQGAQVAAARERATIVLAVSETTARALRARGVPDDRIVVTPNGVTALPPPDTSLVPTEPFLLAVGSITPRKGLAVLAAALAGASVPDRLRLVLAGPDGWRSDEVLASIRAHGVEHRVVRTGWVTDAQLAGLYEACVAVCVPSVAEGFGLPVLEAASLGATVVASDIPVFREVGAGAVAVHCPPDDVAAWSRAIERVVGDDALRRAAAEAGPAAVRGQGWERTAALTVAAYHRAAGWDS